jgi:hypothetical protein
VILRCLNPIEGLSSVKEGALKKRKVIKGEKHHWWPEGLSKYWENERGLVHRIDFRGEVIRSSPKEFGQISDGHNILFEGESPWQSTIENYFDKADRNMPTIVDWLASLKSEVKTENTRVFLYLSQEREDDNLDALRECIISLAVRSPKYRNAQNSFVEMLRGKLEKAESKRLIAANIHQKYGTLVQNSKGTGKFAILFSEEFEFIFGDGFYSNINAATEHLFGVKIVIPMTPHIAVAWSSPMAYRSYPRLISIKADKEIVEIVNNSVQVYSKEYLFFRTQKPSLIEDFKLGKHKVYGYQTDPVYTLIDSLIPDENRKQFGLF